uniref:Uncharacterized protein n=1 Tax=Arundo donax TaxID=35708 RepID=A0A0A9ESH3_ARUDO
MTTMLARQSAYATTSAWLRSKTTMTSGTNTMNTRGKHRLASDAGAPLPPAPAPGVSSSGVRTGGASGSSSSGGDWRCGGGWPSPPSAPARPATAWRYQRAKQ